MPTTESNSNHAVASAPSTTDLLEERTPSENTPLLDRKYLQPSPTPSSQAGAFDASSSGTRLLIAISYASFSGIISGMCLVFAKSGVELLLLTLQGQNQFWRWQTWVLLVGLGIFALLQLWYLHKALILADPTLVCPCEVFRFLSMWVIDIGIQRHSVSTIFLPLLMEWSIMINSR